METLTTNGIRISVETLYQPEHSRPQANKYVHSYRITIENNSRFTVQLLRRHWYIQDSSGLLREVEGDGVIGQQPTLTPGASHTYTSWCPLTTEVGKMYGAFLMVRKSNMTEFKVQIPEFKLVASPKLN